MSLTEIENFFDNDGMLYGYNGSWEHAVFIDGYNSENHTFHCYDSVTGDEYDINVGAFSQFGGYLIGGN